MNSLVGFIILAIAIFVLYDQKMLRSDRVDPFPKMAAKVGKWLCVIVAVPLVVCYIALCFVWPIFTVLLGIIAFVWFHILDHRRTMREWDARYERIAKGGY